MGRKQNQEKPPVPEPQKNEAEEEESPVVKQLKEIDDRYMALEMEYLKEVAKLQASYEDKFKPILDERATKLAGESNDEAATPALPKFWLEAMQNHSQISCFIQDHDEPVLECLQNITHEYIDKENQRKGMRMKFFFAPNKFFDHRVLSVELLSDDQDKPTMWRNENAPGIEVKCDPAKIEWKPDQDVTVEKTQKKVKGGGKKKAKQKKETVEPRDSFFRFLFRSVKVEDELPDDLIEKMKELSDDMEDDEDDEDGGTTEDYLEVISDVLTMFGDQLIPFAVRWYTNEADPDDDIDFDEDEEEEEEDDDDDDDDDDSPKGGKKGRGKGRAAPKKNKGKSPKDSPAIGPADEPKKEECKQQ